MSTFLKSILADCRSMHKWIFWLESIIATPKIHRDEWCRRVNASKFRFIETKQNQFRLRQWMYARGLWRFSVFLCDVEMLDECRRRCLPFCYHHHRRRHWELILFLIKNRIDFDAYQILIYTWKRHKCMRFNSTWVRENENERSQWIFEEWKKKIKSKKDWLQSNATYFYRFLSIRFILLFHRDLFGLATLRGEHNKIERKSRSWSRDKEYFSNAVSFASHIFFFPISNRFWNENKIDAEPTTAWLISLRWLCVKVTWNAFDGRPVVDLLFKLHPNDRGGSDSSTFSCRNEISSSFLIYQIQPNEIWINEKFIVTRTRRSIYLCSCQLDLFNSIAFRRCSSLVLGSMNALIWILVHLLWLLFDFNFHFLALAFPTAQVVRSVTVEVKIIDSKRRILFIVRDSETITTCGRRRWAAHWLSALNFVVVRSHDSSSNVRTKRRMKIRTNNKCIWIARDECIFPLLLCSAFIFITSLLFPCAFVRVFVSIAFAFAFRCDVIEPTQNGILWPETKNQKRTKEKQ